MAYDLKCSNWNTTSFWYFEILYSGFSRQWRSYACCFYCLCFSFCTHSFRIGRVCFCWSNSVIPRTSTVCRPLYPFLMLYGICKCNTYPSSCVIYMLTFSDVCLTCLFVCVSVALYVLSYHGWVHLFLFVVTIFLFAESS